MACEDCQGEVTDLETDIEEIERISDGRQERLEELEQELLDLRGTIADAIGARMF